MDEVGAVPVRGEASRVYGSMILNNPPKFMSQEKKGERGLFSLEAKVYRTKIYYLGWCKMQGEGEAKPATISQTLLITHVQKHHKTVILIQVAYQKRV